MKLLILPSSKIKDIRGQTFGRLTVLEYAFTDKRQGNNAFWLCLCTCGKQTIVSSSPLRAGGTKSCGCLASEESRKTIKRLHNIGQHLYFVKCGEFIKIGRTNNVKSRISQLKSMNPYPVFLLKVLENEGFREKEFHEKFNYCLHFGEWFKISETDLNV